MAPILQCLVAMKPISGAVAGAIGGAAGSYTMELFQTWWNDLEKRTAPKPAPRSAAAKQDEPATVKVAERASQKIQGTGLPADVKPAAGEAVHYTMGAATGAVYGFVAEILPPARMFNGLLMGTIVWWTADNMAVPAQGLGKKPSQVPPSQHAYALASHLVYGFTTELVRGIVRLVL